MRAICCATVELEFTGSLPVRSDPGEVCTFFLLFFPLLMDLFRFAFGAQVVFTSTVLIVEWHIFLSFLGLSSW